MLLSVLCRFIRPAAAILHPPVAPSQAGALAIDRLSIGRLRTGTEGVWGAGRLVYRGAKKTGRRIVRWYSYQRTTERPPPKERPLVARVSISGLAGDDRTLPAVLNAQRPRQISVRSPSVGEHPHVLWPLLPERNEGAACRIGEVSEILFVVAR